MARENDRKFDNVEKLIVSENFDWTDGLPPHNEIVRSETILEVDE